ncbi:MAG: succinyl-diaminopimelate desuccinylase [Rickettsiales bacterium]
MFRQEELDFLDRLIKCKSVAPEDDGAIDTIIDFLGKNFSTNKLVFGQGEKKVSNLYAEIGRGKKNLCFSGHTDVVPSGPIENWKYSPFKLNIKNQIAFGRGMVDMKGAIFSFIVALKEFVSENIDKDAYKISLLISGSEEGDPQYGMVSLIEWIQKNKITINNCVVGEPTSEKKLGDTIKIGRRGSITFSLKIFGTQGHIAYPSKAHNPITDLVKILNGLKEYNIDDGNQYFEKSNLEISNIEIGNSTSNIIPSEARATFNVRNNNCKTPKKIIADIKNIIEKTTKKYQLDIHENAKSFISKPSNFTNLIKNAVREISPSSNPILSTSGGTSDARFLQEITNVAELGLMNDTAHQINESSSIQDMYDLKRIYKEILKNYF